MYSKEELISKPIEELETIAKTLGSDLSAADGAEALVNFIIGDFSEEEEKPKKKASTKKAEKTEGEEPVVKKKRGRPSKADLAARAAEEALKKRLKKDRIKGKSSGSMMLYKKVSNKDLGVTNCNLYTKVEGMGRKCNLYLFLERENGNFITAGDPEEGSIMKYMESLTKDVEALQHKNKVNEQKKAYEKAEKKYQKLVKQQNKLEKKVEKADKARQEEKAALEELQKQEK